MLNCRLCNNELVFQPISKTEIILKCSNKNCGFETIVIKLDPSYIKTQIIQNLDNSRAKQIDWENNQKRVVAKNGSQKIDELIGEVGADLPQVILKRSGRLKDFNIYCIDFSNRMDSEIIYEDLDLKSWRGKIENSKILPSSIKNLLLELIEPPISFFRAITFIFSILILENIKKMALEDFQCFHLISFAGDAEEIYRFPNFSKQTTPEIISDFVNIMNIKRLEKRSNDLLEFRDYSKAIDVISDSLIDLKESFPDEFVEIFLLAIGDHKSTLKTSVNPIRKIKYQMEEELSPFSFNIINFNNKKTSDKNYLQIAQRFKGIFSKETSFKGILNAVLYKRYKTEKRKRELKIPPINVEDNIELPLPPNISGKVLESKTKSEIEDLYKKKSDKKIKDWKRSIPKIIIENEADELLSKLMKDKKVS